MAMLTGAVLLALGLAFGLSFASVNLRFFKWQAF
jgi:hypothetical protein